MQQPATSVPPISNSGAISGKNHHTSWRFGDLLLQLGAITSSGKHTQQRLYQFSQSIHASADVANQANHQSEGSIIDVTLGVDLSLSHVDWPRLGSMIITERLFASQD